MGRSTIRAMPWKALPPEKKRRNKLVIPLIDAEDERFRQLADDQGLPVATWARGVLRKFAGMDRPRRPGRKKQQTRSE